jgi:hypothetical protein
VKRLLALLVASVALIVAATPVGAGGLLGHPGQVPTGYLYLTEYEVADRVDVMIAAGDLDADRVHKTSTGIILFGTPVDLLIEAGVIREFYVDRFDQIRRFDDPFWGQESNTWKTEWQAAWVWTP